MADPVQSGRLHTRWAWNEAVWRPAIQKLNLGEATFHGLRHTFASTLLSAGVPLTVVSRWLGHASSYVTESTYSHFVPGSDVRGRDILNQVARSAVEPRAELVRGQTEGT
jgi:integrase